jgi:hypothetical protein
MITQVLQEQTPKEGTTEEGRRASLRKAECLERKSTAKYTEPQNKGGGKYENYVRCWSRI